MELLYCIIKFILWINSVLINFVRNTVHFINLVAKLNNNCIELLKIMIYLITACFKLGKYVRH